MSNTLWATVSDMTTQTRKDLVRTGASLTAYAIIGLVGAAAIYGFVLALAAVGQSMGY